ALAEVIAGAQQTLEISIYDFHLPPPLWALVEDAFADAAKRGVTVRLAYNVDHGKNAPVPPPPATDPGLVASLPCATAAIPGVPDLMHHKYIVRDGSSIWSGSTNWTADSWTREENLVVTLESPELA